MSNHQVQAKGLTAEELAQKTIHHEAFTILDVRNEDDFSNWKIEGSGIRIINIPYFELLEGVEQVMEQLPDHLLDDQELVVVCAKEGSSIFVAEQLVEQGMSDVSYLKGGMKAWGEHLEPVRIGDVKGGGSLYQFVRIGKGCLSYMVISNGEAAVIDAARMTDVYENFAKDHHAVITHTFDTHLHADHISGGRRLAERTGASYWLPPKDADEVVFDYHKLEEQTVIAVGHSSISIQPLYSPGHTIGSTSLIIDDVYLLSGDTLFVQSIGRPDLAGKAGDWAGDLRDTLYTRYKQLSEELIVLPAHFGSPTELSAGGKVAARLGDLYRENSGLNIENEAQFRKKVTENLPPQPNAYQEIRQTNMGRVAPSEEEQQAMEIGPNRCAVHDN